MSLLASVHETLADAGIGHAVIGATAMASYGVSRSTLDTDLLTVQTVCLLDECWAELQRNGVNVTIMRGDRDDPLAGVVRLRKEQEAHKIAGISSSSWQWETRERSQRISKPIWLRCPSTGKSSGRGHSSNLAKRTAPDPKRVSMLQTVDRRR